MGVAEFMGQRLGMSESAFLVGVKVISGLPSHVEAARVKSHVKAGFAIWKVNISP